MGYFISRRSIHCSVNCLVRQSPSVHERRVSSDVRVRKVTRVFPSERAASRFVEFHRHTWKCFMGNVSRDTCPPS